MVGIHLNMDGGLPMVYGALVKLASLNQILGSQGAAHVRYASYVPWPASWIDLEFQIYFQCIGLDSLMCGLWTSWT